MNALLLLLVALHTGSLTTVRVADAVCAQCHAQIVASYLKTPMANASGPTAERLLVGAYGSQHAGIQYTMENAAGTPVLAWRDLRDASLSGRWTLSYFLGSGHLGTTWLYFQDQYLFESPIALLTPIRAALSRDKAALDALGTLSVERGDERQGEEDYRRVLALDPLDVTALSNLAVLLARRGDPAESLKLLQQAFSRNQNMAGLAMDLARVQCIAGDIVAIRQTLEAALKYNPADTALQKLMAQGGACPAIGLRVQP